MKDRSEHLRTFVGRERELAALQQALARSPTVVLVEGEAGIGKTRLIQEFLASSAVQRRTTMLGMCLPFRESLTLSPIVGAIVGRRNSIAGLQLSPLAGALRPLFPEWAADLPPAPEPINDAKASRHRLFRALAELVERLGVEVLVVEDAHWADDATLEFLLFLTARPQPRPLCLIVTCRPEDIGARSLVLRLVARTTSGTTRDRLTLPPLDEAGTAVLVSSMLDEGPVSEAFATFLYEHTEGLPLLIEESVRLLRDRDDLLRVGGEWMRRSLDELRVPPTVRDAVVERLQRLRPATRRVLDAAAVLGDSADEGLLREVAGLAASPMQAGMQQALASGLLQENERGRFAFRHVLMGRAVYETISAPARWRLHLRAGSALEATTPQPVGQLVRHFREAAADERWCRYAIEAAERAIAADDHTSAVVLINDVLATADLPPQVQAQLAHRLVLAAVFRRDAVDDLDRQVAQTLRDLLDRGALAEEQTAEIRGLLGRLLNRLGDFEAALAEMELAIPHLGHRPADAARYMINLGLPAGRWPVAVHRRWLRRAAEAESRISTPVERLALTVDRASALLMLGEEDGWAAAAQIPSTAPSLDERRQIARGYFNVGSAALVWGRYAEARRRLTAALDFAAADQYVRLRPHILVALAELKWFTGAWDVLADEAAVLGASEEIASSARRVTHRIIGRLHAARGTRDLAEEHANRALDEARRSGALDELLEPAAALGRLHLYDQHVGDAVQVTDEPMQMLLAKGIWVWATDIAPVRVEALVAAGDMDDAARLVAKFTRGLRGRNAPAPRAALALCRAHLAAGIGDQARAAAAFGRAAQAWDLLPRPYDVLRSREREATCLLAAGRVEQGLALLSDVHRDLTDLGAVGDLGRVERSLREHGVKVARPWRGGRRGYGDQLSPHELEVVRLVVAGKTDQQIAGILSKSPRTVAVQVNAAKRKLQASSRTALAVHAMQMGIAPPSADKSGG